MAMPKVEIKPGPNHGHRLFLDGVDMTEVVHRDGFRIVWDEHGPVVYMKLQHLTELNAELQDAVLRIIQDQPTDDRGSDTELGPGGRELARYLGEMGADVDAIKRRLDGLESGGQA